MADGAPTAATDERKPNSLVPLIFSQLFTGTASWSLLIGVLGYATYQLHAEPLQAGMLGLVWGAPPVLLGILVGRLIDARGPKLVATVAGLGSITASLGLVLLPGWELLLALVLLSGMGRAFVQPAVDAMPTWLAHGVDHRASSVWLGFATNVPVVLGPLVSVGMISLGGIASVFWISAAMHLASLVITISMRVRRPRGHLYELAEPTGVLPVLRLKIVRSILALSLAVWLSYGCYTILEILYVRDVLKSTVNMFTLLQTSFGAGLLITNSVLVRFMQVLTSRRTLIISVVFIGITEALYVCSSKAVVSAVGALLWGIGAAVFGPVCRASLLESVPDEQHGEVMAAWRSVQAAGSLVSPLVVGTVGQLIGTQLTMIGTSVMVVIAGLVMWQALVMRHRSQNNTTVDSVR